MLQGQVNNAVNILDMKTMDRKAWHARENGTMPGHVGKINMILIIPYCRHDYEPENILDKERIMGTYISSAREHEMVDIKLQKQAM